MDRRLVADAGTITRWAVASFRCLLPTSLPWRHAGWLLVALLITACGSNGTHGQPTPASTPAPTPTPTVGPWLAVRDTDLIVPPGSVLDFSSLVAAGPAGRSGRIVAGPTGQLAFATQPDKPQRFLCASQPFGPAANRLPAYAEIDTYVHQLRLHGYNLARFHRLESLLMQGATQDFGFDPVQLDRLYYLMAALKREGIYWLVDGLSQDRGGYAQAAGHDTNLGVYYDPPEQDHWKQLVAKLWGAKNPYTQLSTLEDPALAGIILVNEGGLAFILRNTSAAPAGLQARFVDWLKARYGDTATLTAAWGDLAPSESLEQGIINLPLNSTTRSPRQADLQRFYTDLEAATANWMTQYLRGLGYPGLVTSLDNQNTLQAHAARSHLAWVDQHGYHDYPTGFLTGTRTQASSFGKGAAVYVQNLALARYAGRPFTVSEYGQPFWNAWRRESGLVVPGYAALQGWDMLCEHAAGPIELAYGQSSALRREAIYPFGVGMDPITRVGQTLAALLYLRGDVAPARAHIAVELSPSYVFDERAGLEEIPSDIKQLALLTGVGLRWAESVSNTASTETVVRPGDLATTTAPWATRVRQLRTAGLLPADNVTNPTTSVFQSDTGELLLETNQRRLRVITPNTEAVAFDQGLPLTLSRLTVEASDGPALVGAASLDGRPLGDSGRMLILLATDAQNSGMLFADPEQRQLLELGHLPVLLRTARVTVRLAHNAPSGLQLYATALNGSRRESIPLEQVPGGVRFTLDIAALRDGPTTFFELVKI
jgi:hypothetical protein